MTALSDLVIRIRQMMQSFSQSQQQWAYLATGISSSDTTFTVNDATQISRGLCEMDNGELVLVKSVNRQTNLVTLDPFGRGWNGTTAVAHLANARIENNPVWPNIRVKEAINDVIRGLYPDLFAVGTTAGANKIIKVSVQLQYPLPADCEEIISVIYDTIGPDKRTPSMRRWRFNGQALPSNFPTGRSIHLLDDVTPGREIFVTYRKEPTELVNDSDDFAAVTGLPSSAQDLIVYGACMKLAPALEAPRLLLNSTEANEKAGSIPPGSSMRVSQAYGQLYMQRLSEERRKLNDRFQQPFHHTA